jgi:transposase
MSYFIGMDVHSNNTMAAIVDENLKRIHHKRLSNNLETILDFLDPFRENIENISVEATFNWYWLVDGLMDHQYTVFLANPGKLYSKNEAKCTDDKYDAYYLAIRSAEKKLPKGYIYPKEQRSIRDLLRTRTFLKKQRTSFINRVKFLIQNNIAEDCPTAIIKKLQTKEIQEKFSNSNVQMSVQVSIDIINHFTSKIHEIEKCICSQLVSSPMLNRLQSVTGIGTIIALTILLETGEISRFENSGNYSSYCRCSPAQKTSNNKTKGSKNKKNGTHISHGLLVKPLSFSFDTPNRQKNIITKNKKKRKLLSLSKQWPINSQKPVIIL